MRNPLAGRKMSEPCSDCGGSGAVVGFFLVQCEGCAGTGRARIRCSQCWKWKAPSAFLGPKGNIRKRCDICTDKYKNWDKKTLEERERATAPRSNIPDDGPLRVTLNLRSGNRKTGPIPTSITSARTCPKGCSLYGKGCYAEQHILSIHWRRVSSGRGLTWTQFCSQVSMLPPGQIWRHNEAGDLPGDDGAIDARKLRALVEANRGKLGFTYTHKPLTIKNLLLIQEAIAEGFAINISADSPEEADRAMSIGLPTTLVVPASYAHARGSVLPSGRRIVICPAVRRDDVTCETCQLCAVSSRKSAVGFPAHGDRKSLVSQRLRQLPLIQ